MSLTKKLRIITAILAVCAIGAALAACSAEGGGWGFSSINLPGSSGPNPGPNPPVPTPPGPVDPSVEPGTDAPLSDRLAWARDYYSDNEYDLLITGDISLDSAITLDGNYPTIRLKGNGTERTISFAGSPVFSLGNGASLILDEGINVRNEFNTTGYTAVRLAANSYLTMESGSKISGSNVNVNGGTFNMRGGTISGGNDNNYTGGGVYVEEGIFNMEDGTISGNTTSYGGGVGVGSNGTFNMKGGEISGNQSSGGGGVQNEGIFNMEGGTISNNTVTYGLGGDGAGVNNTGTFTMSGGNIEWNESDGRGGGVYLYSGTFNMNGNTTISNNQATTDGGGVYVRASGTFIINGGAISGNTASNEGDGVYVENGATYTKTDDSNVSDTVEEK